MFRFCFFKKAPSGVFFVDKKFFYDKVIDEKTIINPFYLLCNMKRIISVIVILMTVLVCANARIANGCYSDSHRGGYSHDRTCRVVEGKSYCTDYSGTYISINPGFAFSPDMGFVGSLGFGGKFTSGMTVGLRLNGKYVNKRAGASVGLASTYEFSALRQYTDIFYPVIGFEGGFSGIQIEGKQWDALPYVGYKAGFRFACVRGKFDIGFEYSGNYHFAIKGLADHSSNFLEHSVALAICTYF